MTGEPYPPEHPLRHRYLDRKPVDMFAVPVIDKIAVGLGYVDSVGEADWDAFAVRVSDVKYERAGAARSR